MKILVLGDVMGPSGRNALKKIFPKLLKIIKLIFQLSMVKMLQMTAKELHRKLQKNFSL